MERYHPAETVVVAPSMAFGARLAQEKGVPTVSMHLQPSILRSLYETPVYSGLRLGLGMPRWLKRLVFRLIDGNIDRILTPGLNAFRSDISLGPVRGVFNGWMESPDCVIGLFPEWFAAPQPDWPPQTHLVGFPLYDAAGVDVSPDALEAFLQGGEPPIIFTVGSAMKQGRWFFEESVKACERLGCRGLLINKFRNQIPEKLPLQVFHAEFAPFSQVFPRGKMVVHHGGIGTTAQALAAGLPQLLVPLAFDQFDQAARVERLGVGGTMARRDYRAEPVARKLQKLLETPTIARRAQDLVKFANGPRSIAQACDLIERFNSPKRLQARNG